MSSKTKIIVLHHKHLLYLLIGIIAILFTLLLILIHPKSVPTSTAPVAADSLQYKAGKYSASLTLNGKPVEIQVTMDSNIIHDIELLHLAESIETIYPLFHNCFDDIANQVIASNSTQNITYSDENQYTCIALLNAIDNAIAKSVQ